MIDAKDITWEVTHITSGEKANVIQHDEAGTHFQVQWHDSGLKEWRSYYDFVETCPNKHRSPSEHAADIFHEDILNNVDMINEPPHYKSEAGIESLDVIEAFDLDFKLGNVVKYILRHDKKGKPLDDLKKARFYLDRKISELENKGIDK